MVLFLLYSAFQCDFSSKGMDHEPQKLSSLGFAGILSENSGPWISCGTDLIPRMKAHRVSQSPQLLPPSDKVPIIATEDFTENLKATAEGSKLQKVSTQFQSLQLNAPKCKKLGTVLSRCLFTRATLFVPAVQQ